MCLQTADQLLARADAAKALAEEAAKKGRNTLQEANDILNNLKGMKGSNRINLYASSIRVISFFFFILKKILPCDFLNIHNVKDNSIKNPIYLSSRFDSYDFYYTYFVPQHPPYFFCAEAFQRGIPELMSFYPCIPRYENHKKGIFFMLG